MIEPTFRLQVAYALRNYAENWEIRDLARQIIKDENIKLVCRNRR
jgi:hypothetical protein